MPELNMSLPRRRIAAQHGGWKVPIVARSNAGTQVTGTDRMAFTPFTDCRAPEFIFANGYADATGLLNLTGNLIKFHAAVEVGGNQLVPIPFECALGETISASGKTAKVVGDGQFVHSLPLAGGVYAAASTQYYRVHKKVGAGERWPYIMDRAMKNGSAELLNTTDFVYGSTVVDGTDQTTAQNAQGWGPFAATAYAWTAVAIIAEQVTTAPVVLITGDSIPAGSGSTIGQGYIGSACDNASIGYHNDALAGSSLNNLTKYGELPQYLARFADHVAIHSLTNDLYGGGVADLTAAKALVLSAAKAFGTRQNTLWFSTILPRTTGAWSSYGGQTKSASYEDLRVAINNWLRDPGATGAKAYLNANLSVGYVGGIIDATPAIERNVDGSAVVLDASGQQTTGTGGYWLLNRTADGIHPDATAVAAMALLVPTASFTVAQAA